MFKKQHISIFILLLLCFWVEADLFSQCAMCKENLQYDLENGSGVGKNINNGILYIMAVPYILILVVGGILYKNVSGNSPKN